MRGDQPQEEIEENELENEGESQIIRRDNSPMVDHKAYDTEGNEAQLIQMIQIIDKMTGGKKATGEAKKKAEFNFMLDLKTLVAKSATDADLNRVRDAMRRGENNTAPEQFRSIFEKLSNKWIQTFKDEKKIIPIELRKKLMETLQIGHTGTTKMLAEARIFWWSDISNDIENRTKNCAACLATSKN